MKKISVEIYSLSRVNSFVNSLLSKGYEISDIFFNACSFEGRVFPVLEFRVPASQADAVYRYFSDFCVGGFRYLKID